MPKLLTLKEFKIRSVKKHGEKYDYSKTIYINKRTKLTIICPIHEDFEQLPPSHYYRGDGCWDCGVIKSTLSRTFSQTECIHKAKIKHNNKYQYKISKNYKDTSSELNIICPVHGLFKQEASSHLFGKGCKKCGNIISGKKLRYSNDEFIKLSKIKHGDKYSYKKTKYIRGNDKVTIICKLHGEFQQRANGHLTGNGCDDCGEEIKSKNSRLKISVIEQRINTIWGKNKYKLVSGYRNNQSICEVKCLTHNIILPTRMNRFLLGSTPCIKCQPISIGEELIADLLSNIKIKFIRQKKFKDCIFKKELPFDFYLPQIKTCIEFDGKQHFQSVKLWGGDKAYKERIKKDQIRNLYCIKNNIKLIRIKYCENYLDLSKKIKDELIKLF